MSWGTKITYFVYVEGERPDIDELNKGALNLDAVHDADFIGVRLDTVEEKPVDQVAT